MPPRETRPPDPLAVLSEREREVLRLMPEGLSDRGIAQRLVVSTNTVGTHIQHVFTKLGIPGSSADNRRVRAVLAWLQQSSMRPCPRATAQVSQGRRASVGSHEGRTVSLRAISATAAGVTLAVVTVASQLEDKIVQRAVAEVLNAIYEVDFRGFSYGFRLGRKPHDALDALSVGIRSRRVNWVLDADIRDFFGQLDRIWLRRFLESSSCTETPEPR